MSATWVYSGIAADVPVVIVSTKIQGIEQISGDYHIITGVKIDHADINDTGTNTHAEIDTHIASDGSDHTFIDQDVTTTGTPTFYKLTTTAGRINNITGIISGHTALATDEIITCGAGNQTFTIALPAVSVENTGKVYHIKNVGTGTITIDGSGAETIDGATTKLLSAQYDCMSIVSDGSAWWVI
jgi:hypothetical protein